MPMTEGQTRKSELLEEFQGTYMPFGSVTVLAHTPNRVPNVTEFVRTLGTSDGNFHDPTPHSYVIDERRGGWERRSQVYGQLVDNRWRTWSADGTRQGVNVAMDRTVQCKRAQEISSTSRSLEAYAKALGKLTGRAGSMNNITVDLAEAGKTKQMVQAYGKFNELIDDFFDGIPRFGKAHRSPYGGRTPQGRTGPYSAYAAKVLGKAWLEHRYGWMPLVYSIQDALDGMSDHVDSFYQTLSSRAGIYDEDSIAVDDRGSFNGLPNYLGTVHWQSTTTHHSSSEHRCQLTVRLKPASNPFDAYSSFDPAMVAWELVPFSWMVDWMVDISGWLTSIETALLLSSRFHDGYRTFTSRMVEFRSYRLTEEVRSRAGLPYASGLDSLMVEQLAPAVIGKTKNRQPLATVPFPAMPAMKLKLNAKRVTDLAALAAGSFDSHMRRIMR